MFSAQSNQLVPIRIVLAVNKRVNVLQVSKAVGNRLDLPHHNFAFQNDQLSLAMLKDILIILRRDGRIYRH